LKLDLDGFQQIGLLMPALILLAAAASLFVMLGRLIHAQRTQIGLMKALGHTRRAILFHFLSLAVAIALFGSALGVAAGYPLGHLITSAYAQELGIPLVESRLYADVLLVGTGVSVLVAFLAGLWPATRASRVAPADALRPNATQGIARSGRSVLERVVPLSVWGRLPLRNVFRIPSRSLSTLVGVVFAFVLVIASLALIESMSRIVSDTFTKVERWDLQASYQPPLPMNTLSQVAAQPGVRRVEPILQVPVTLSSSRSPEGPKTEVMLTALETESTMHALTLQSGVPRQQALAQDRIVISPAIARKLGVAVGGSVDAHTPLGSVSLTVGALSDEMMSAVAYTSLGTAEGWIPSHARVFNGLFLTTDGPSVRSVQSFLYSLPGAASVQVKSAVRDSWDSLMGFYYLFMAVILVFAFAMAFALLFNAMTVNVLEQQRELATMRSIGAPGRRVAFLMIAENLALWALALVPGLVLGTWVAHRMGEALQSDLLSIDIAVSPASYLLTAAGILAIMILAGLPAIRRVNRLNLATATKMLT
jgi:putative ABC transport system permease protein